MTSGSLICSIAFPFIHPSILPSCQSHTYCNFDVIVVCFPLSKVNNHFFLMWQFQKRSRLRTRRDVAGWFLVHSSSPIQSPIITHHRGVVMGKHRRSDQKQGCRGSRIKKQRCVVRLPATTGLVKMDASIGTVLC
jgi:hypothetical protein